MRSISITSQAARARGPNTRALGSGTAAADIRRDVLSSRDMTRLRSLPMVGVALALMLAVTGCCAGYCSSSPPPVGSGVQHHGLEHVASRSAARVDPGTPGVNAAR